MAGLNDSEIRGVNIVKCYSGGKIVRTIKLTKGLDYEPDENGFTIANARGLAVFIWNGTFSLENSNGKV